MGLSFLTQKPVEHVVDKESGQTAKFFPISLSMAFELRGIAGPLVRGLTVLFARRDTDHTQKSKSSKTSDGFEQEGMTLAIDHPLAKLRHEQQQAAVTEIVTALTSPENSKVICKVIMDSMREDFPRPVKSDAVDKFMQDTPLPVLGKLLMGVAKANAELFGPLADLVPIKVQELTDRIGRTGTAAKVAAEAASAPSEAAPVAP